MARKPDMLGVASADTVIGSGVKLKGNLATEGDIAVDGKLAGNVKSEGNITIGVNAHIVGDVSGISVSIAGRLEGNIKAEELTSILATGQVAGDVTTTSLQVETGAVFIGASKMKPVEATEVLERLEVESPKPKN